MLTPVRSAQFKRDVKRIQKRGKNIVKLRVLLRLLIERALSLASLRTFASDRGLVGACRG